MPAKLDNQRWWVIAVAALVGADAAVALADDRPAGPAAAAVEIDRSPEAIDRAVTQLGDASPAARERAAATLRAIGKPARPALDRAIANAAASPEAVARARTLVAEMDVPLAVVLSAATTKVKAGPALPPITVDVRNVSDKPATVCKPLDGSSLGWRVATYEWVVTNESGTPVRRLSALRCGNVNELTTRDFVRLEPGQALTMKPGHGLLGSPGDLLTSLAPGLYRVSLRYAFDPKKEETGIGGGVHPGVADLVAATTQGEFTSNVLTIEVTK